VPAGQNDRIDAEPIGRGRLRTAGNPHATKYADMLRTMAATLVALQGSDGFWRSSLLDPALYPQPETSGTALITFALAYGIKAGLLDAATYQPAVAKAWQALSTLALQPNGFVTDCQPTAAADHCGDPLPDKGAGAVETTLTSQVVTAVVPALTDTLRLRLQVSGNGLPMGTGAVTTLRAKVWKTSATEPAAWLLTATDGTAGLQGAGGVGVWAYLSGSATNAPVTASVDNLSVDNLSVDNLSVDNLSVGR